MEQLRKSLGLRPLTARSVIASTLLGMHPPALPAWVLVRSGSLFGIAEGTTRVALSRMVAAGELEAVDGSYRLAGRLLRRQARQAQSRSPRLRRWRGDWLLALAVADRRSAPARAAWRATMAEHRFAELREGVWARPDNLPAPPPDGDGCVWWRGRPDGDERAVAARAFALDEWADRAARLREAMASLADELDAGDRDALAPAFEVSAAVLRHFQADPLLPAELLPDGWPGDALREEYDRYDAAFSRVWRSWYRSLRAGGE